MMPVTKAALFALRASVASCLWMPFSGSGLTRSGGCVEQIRESIKALFPSRDCFSLVRPHNDERQLAQLEALPAGQLRPEFREVCNPVFQTGQMDGWALSLWLQSAHPAPLT